MEVLIFFLLTAGTLVFSGNVVFRRNPAVCAVHLVGAFFCLSGIYLLIGFPFLAALQLMVYAGAIMVLFLFVIMLLDLRREGDHEMPWSTTIAPLFAGGIFALLWTVIDKLPVHSGRLPALSAGRTAARGGEGLAAALFSKHLLAFEATSLLILVGIVGVVLLAKRRPHASRNLTRYLEAVGAQTPSLEAAPRPDERDEALSMEESRV
ncbi:MAG: NADH-quinone oxidoreductase subunit J [Planctomycetota bacterium]